MFLVIVDSRSKLLEVIPIMTTTTERTLEVLNVHFSAHGLPEQIVLDKLGHSLAQDQPSLICVYEEERH